MKSIEQAVANFVALAEKNGKGKEARAIIQESPGKFLERKAHELEILTKPFAESFNESGKAPVDQLVESFMVNFKMTEAEAKVAAGANYAPMRNGRIDLKG
jgi:hypothetical protein